jgi:hypothetical protein
LVSHQGNPKAITCCVSLPAYCVPAGVRFHNLADGAGRLGCRVS